MSSSPEKIEGTLKIFVIAGKDLPNRDRFKKQDAAVQFTIGTEKRRTKIDHKGGSNPSWNDTVLFHINGAGQTSLLIEVVDIDGSKSEEVCSGVVDLRKIFVEEESDAWHPLKRKDKPAGKIYIEFTFEPKGGRKKPHKAPEPVLEENSPAIANAPLMGNSSTGSMASIGTNPSQNNTANTAPSSMLSPPGKVPPSMADLRPHSSAAMYRPEFAAQYATAHGKKPLPSTPPTGSPRLQAQQDTVMPGKQMHPSVMDLFSPPPSDTLHIKGNNSPYQQDPHSMPDFHAEPPYNPDFDQRPVEEDIYDDFQYQKQQFGSTMKPKPLPSLPPPTSSYYEPAEEYPAYNPAFADEEPPHNPGYNYVEPYPSSFQAPMPPQHQSPYHQNYMPSAPPIPGDYDEHYVQYGPYEQHQQQQPSYNYEPWNFHSSAHGPSY